MTDISEDEADVKAISAIISALKPLEAEVQVYVLEFVLKKLGVVLNAPQTPASHVPSAAHTIAVASSPPPHVPPQFSTHDVRTFAEQKKPKTVNEKVAVIGYYLVHLAPEADRRDYLTSEDIKTYFIQAGFELPSAKPNMTLLNAKNAGYLSATDRGQYKLNSVGHNLVAHKLPSVSAVAATRPSASLRTRKKTSMTRRKAGK